jgi:AcrR family transcriptional regulator
MSRTTSEPVTAPASPAVAPLPDPGEPATPEDPAPGGTGPSGGTRERILDIALDLFTTQGYDKTSLRQIADRLGFSKAAIYYHFASKDEILLALHMRLHDFGREALATIGHSEATPEMWEQLLYGLIDQMLDQRALFMLHERNRAAFEQLHRERHDADHDDLEARFRIALTNERIALADRVRLACAFGAVLGGLVQVGDAFSEVPSEELGAMLRDAVGDLLGPSRAAR